MAHIWPSLYVIMQEAEIKTSKEAFNLLLEQVNTSNASAAPAPSPLYAPGALTVHPILNEPPLDHENCPNVIYWTRKDWDKSERGPGFVTNLNGVSISADEILAIHQTAYSIWRKLADIGCAPQTWGQNNHITIDYYRLHMYAAHPVLQLCHPHWKVNLIATEEYPAWYHNNKHTFKSVKHQNQTANSTKTEPTNNASSSVQDSTCGTKHPKSSKDDKHEHSRRRNTCMTW
ncbi:hypothetical protein K439DRAFT_1620963 [Ramaria rubella]|nr:hypothetical protein K439DRAFT_1620963 [Ramaria rubella]